MRYENTTPGHSCYYDINMLETHNEGEWIVHVEWGVIGTKSPKKTIRKKGTFEQCEKEYTRLVRKRLKHKYKPINKNDKSKDTSRIF
jgi:predicted DNA-binding WGR domain protein